MSDPTPAPHADTIEVSPAVLRDLRRDRRRRRVAGIEWFEALYRVYLTGGIGVIAVLFLSSAVGDDPLSPASVDDVRSLAPALVGVVAAVAAVALHIAYHDTAPAAVIAGLALYLVGLDAIEPLAQEIDQADRAGAIPKERGLLLLNHLPAPAVLLALFAVFGGAIGYALNRTSTALGVIAVVALPALWAAGAGAVISVVAEDPEPSASDTNQMLPPEVAGMRLMFRTVWPVVVCCLGTLPVIGARSAASRDLSPAAGAAQAAMLAFLVIVLTVLWLRFREPARAWFREMMKESQAESSRRAAARAGGST